MDSRDSPTTGTGVGSTTGTTVGQNGSKRKFWVRANKSDDFDLSHWYDRVGRHAFDSESDSIRSVPKDRSS